MRATVSLLVLCCALTPLCAQTYWSENFDSYPTGQLASSTGGWYGWNNAPFVMSDIVAGPALSPSNSLQNNGADDTIYPWALNDPSGYPRSCQWRLTAQWYIDGATFVPGSGNQHFILNNSYTHGGPYIWAMQLTANPSTMMITDFYRPGPGVPIVVDQWVPLQIDIDLDADTISVSYNNTTVSAGVYTASGGPTEIANLNLYSSAASNACYYDDLALTRLLPPEYQQNTAVASVDLDGVQSPGCAPAVVNKNPTNCGGLTPDPATLNVASSNSLGVFEIMYNFLPLVPATGGGFALPGGQVLNLSFLGGFSWLAGGTAPSFQPVPPGGSASVVVSIAANFDVSIQGLFSDPASPIGFSLSQASELHVVVTAGGVAAPGPTGDDASVDIDVVSAPYCWTTSGIPFYGTVFTTMTVVSNGRVQFGTNPNLGWTPSAGVAISDDPSVNFWTDMSPNIAGTITATSPSFDIVRVDWVGVPFYGQPTALNTFGIEFDTVTGLVTLDGLQGIVPSSGGGQFLGISPGISQVTTDPGAMSFAPSGGGSPGSVTDMLYDWSTFNLLPTLQGGISQVLFAPSTGFAPNYDWASF